MLEMLTTRPTHVVIPTRCTRDPRFSHDNHHATCWLRASPRKHHAELCWQSCTFERSLRTPGERIFIRLANSVCNSRATGAAPRKGLI